MDKPTPKKEIVVRSLGNTLQIDCMSADASEWVKDNVWDFGRLFPAGSFGMAIRYNLYINSSAWDISEVAAWIEKMGAET